MPQPYDYVHPREGYEDGLGNRSQEASLDLRTHLAAMNMAAMLVASSASDLKWIAKKAVQGADALIMALNAEKSS